jgi:hypothetical protein
MSKTKFNNLENHFIVTALQNAIEEAEYDLKEAIKEGKRPIFAPGYFSTVGTAIIEKVNGMTKKDAN